MRLVRSLESFQVCFSSSLSLALSIASEDEKPTDISSCTYDVDADSIRTIQLVVANMHRQRKMVGREEKMTDSSNTKSQILLGEARRGRERKLIDREGHPKTTTTATAERIYHCYQFVPVPLRLNEIFLPVAIAFLLNRRITRLRNRLQSTDRNEHGNMFSVVVDIIGQAEVIGELKPNWSAKLIDAKWCSLPSSYHWSDQSLVVLVQGIRRSVDDVSVCQRR